MQCKKNIQALFSPALCVFFSCFIGVFEKPTTRTPDI